MTSGLVAFLIALLAAYGVFLAYTALAFGWRGIGISPALRRRPRGPGHSFRDFLVQAGLDRVRPVEFVAVAAVLAVVAGAFAFAVWAAALPALVVATVAATVPLAAARTRRRARQDHARDAWPRMIEEIRLQAVTLGRPIPQALLAVGLAGPDETRPAFAAAQREWLISTDFARTLDVLKAHLADPTADAVCETLLVAHDIGGTDVDQRLRALTEDRIQDLQGRKDARSKQAGVRFARLFVLFVPMGMALVGLSIGDGRAAYRSPGGQVAILVAFALMGLCWGWASRLLRLPEEERVFVGTSGEVTQ
jgi:tight adherence protein B